MSSIDEAKVDLGHLAERLRGVAEALKRFPADHSPLPEELVAFREEIQAVAAQLLGERPR